MKSVELKGQGGIALRFTGSCIARVEALNHDDTVRCEMCLYTAEDGYVCQRIDRPNTIDVRYRLERCDDILGVYQFLGTEPLANYLYGVATMAVPGLRCVT